MIEQLLNHRSVRKYTAQPIEEAVLTKILVATQTAPSWCNGQQYSIIQVTDPSTRNELAALAGNQSYVSEAPVFLVFCADFYRSKLACELEGKPFEVTNSDYLLVGATDVGIALGQAVVAAESLGLGTVAIGGVRKDGPRVTELLGLPEYVIPISGLCIGYPAETPDIKPRLPKEAVVHENTYNTDLQPQLEAYNETFATYMKTRNPKSTATWTSGIANFYTNGYPNYNTTEILLQTQGFRKK